MSPRTADRRQILEYMRLNVSDALDHQTNLVNDTSLAEAACAAFDDFIYPEAEIPELYFDLAISVSKNYEDALSGKTKWRE